MRILEGFTTTLCALVLGAMMATGAKADQVDKKTIVTFSDPVEIPGQVLEPGTYVFKLLDPSIRNVVQVWTGDEDHLLATILTIGDYRLEANDKSVVTLYQSDGDQTAAVQSWFFAGETSGRHFVYPEYPTTEESANINTVQ